MFGEPPLSGAARGKSFGGIEPNHAPSEFVKTAGMLLFMLGIQILLNCFADLERTNVVPGLNINVQDNSLAKLAKHRETRIINLEREELSDS